MNRIRLATEEECKSIADNSDLSPMTYVMGLDTKQGVILGVIRQAIELNPVHFPEGLPDRMKYMFMRDIETHLAAKGAFAYYFQIDPAKEEYIATMKHYGAQQVSPIPELRFVRQL